MAEIRQPPSDSSGIGCRKASCNKYAPMQRVGSPKDGRVVDPKSVLKIDQQLEKTADNTKAQKHKAKAFGLSDER